MSTKMSICSFLIIVIIKFSFCLLLLLFSLLNEFLIVYFCLICNAVVSVNPRACGWIIDRTSFVKIFLSLFLCQMTKNVFHFYFFVWKWYILAFLGVASFVFIRFLNFSFTMYTIGVKTKFWQDFLFLKDAAEILFLMANSVDYN